jgi:thiamine-monophosphate kinase
LSTITLDETYHQDNMPAEVASHLVETSLSELREQAVLSKWCTLALSLPYVDEPWIRSFSDELLRLCTVHEMPLAGGDTTRGSGLLVLHTTACLERESPAG